MYTIDIFLFTFNCSFCCKQKKSIPCYSLRQHATNSKTYFCQIYCGWSFTRNESGTSKLIILPYCCCLLLLWWKLITWMLHAFCPFEMSPREFPTDSNSSEIKSMTTNMRTLHKNTPDFHSSRSLGGWSSLLKGFLGNKSSALFMKNTQNNNFEKEEHYSTSEKTKYYWMDSFLKWLLFWVSQSNLQK